MQTQDTLSRFAEDFNQDVLRRAELEDEEAFYSEAFTILALDYLATEGEISDAEVCYFRIRGAEVNAYSADFEEGRLDLVVSIFTNSVPPETVTRDRVEVAFNRLGGFLKRALGGLHNSLEEASPAFDMALQIHEMRENLGRVRLIVLTDGMTTIASLPIEHEDGIEISRHIWDIRRIHRLVTSGQAYEDIDIDFKLEFGLLVPCLPAPENREDYHAYLVLLPGEVLYGIYDRYGPRLLERNVRSFLQARTKVNRGIRDTIKNEPERFLAYNNGISGVAERIELDQLPGGGVGIKRAVGFQIVNGGQTTASIYAAKRRDGADVSGITVQAKLVVVTPERMNEMVPLISRYANNQNAIQEADFSANEPFHIKLEELSRTIWAPAADGTQLQTRWFYERARGQYQDAKSRTLTLARRREFERIHPASQKFTKTDLAKFENTWRQLPYLVSRGAQKNFAEFTLDSDMEDITGVDQPYFQHLVAKAILFRQAEKIVSAQKFGGYRANIVTYSLAYLVHMTQQQIDLDRIWREQRLSGPLRDLIACISHEVHQVITDPPGGRNVTEWCKTESCWNKVLGSLDVRLPQEITSELVPLHGNSHRIVESGIDQLNETDMSNIETTLVIPAEKWFEIAAWAKQTENLKGWQRGLAFSLGRLVKMGREPTIKQAAQGVKIIEEVQKLGFRVSD